MPAADLSHFCAEHDETIDDLALRFADYQIGGGYDRSRVISWLRVFQGQHRELGLRLAECVNYYSTASLIGLLRKLHQSIQNEIAELRIAEDEFCYLPLGRTAESGQVIASLFRNSNSLQSQANRFIQTTDIMEVVFKYEDPAVFFLDDFIGTGKQVCDLWEEVLSQIVLPGYGHYYVCVAVAFSDGVTRIHDNTPLKVLAAQTLDSRNTLLSTSNTKFNRTQKSTLKRYCETIGNEPLGFGELAALVSFAHGTPNNAPSVIRGSIKQRPHRGLLPGWTDI